jgi:hypothetical protein
MDLKVAADGHLGSIAMVQSRRVWPTLKPETAEHIMVINGKNCGVCSLPSVVDCNCVLGVVGGKTVQPPGCDCFGIEGGLAGRHPAPWRPNCKLAGEPKASITAQCLRNMASHRCVPSLKPTARRCCTMNSGWFTVVITHSCLDLNFGWE